LQNEAAITFFLCGLRPTLGQGETKLTGSRLVGHVKRVVSGLLSDNWQSGHWPDAMDVVHFEELLHKDLVMQR
jgi:hypothetical protein